ncbi:MAG: DoxX family protein [Bacteroidota bacterium]|nr:DoxX family protein [Bacteroidota bacterium]
MILAYQGFKRKISGQSAIPLLLMRLALAYGFFETSSMKWAHIHDVAGWFAQLGIPAPTLNAYLSASMEAAGVVLLVLGLGTRLIAVPLMVIMVVAIRTVHWSNGFDAGNNGFEIPLYYLIMLLTLFISGAGKWSLDAVWGKIYPRKIR